jgi:CBS domain-containing protein
VDIWVDPDRLTELPDRTEGAGGLFGYAAPLTGAPPGAGPCAPDELS